MYEELETHLKSPDDFLVNEPGPLGTASETVMTSKPTLNDLQTYYIIDGPSSSSELVDFADNQRCIRNFQLVSDNTVAYTLAP